MFICKMCKSEMKLPITTECVIEECSITCMACIQSEQKAKLAYKVCDFLDAAVEEILRAIELHPSGVHSPHEGYGIILEEVDEFWLEVKKKNPTKEDMYKELTHIAAMCAKVAYYLELIP